MEQVPIQLANIAGQILDWIGQQFGIYGVDPVSVLASGLLIAGIYHWGVKHHS
jgi:hypothetical protein